MRDTIGVALAALAALAWVGSASPAAAQQAASQTRGSTSALTEGAQQNAAPPQPIFRLFGIPFGINAPVSSPYCTCAMDNFAGQPMRSGDAVMAQANGGRR